MKRFLCAIAILLSTGSAPAIAGSCCAEADSAPLGLKLIDGMLVRPVGMVVSMVTSAAYLGTSPLTFLMDVDEPAAHLLVVRPWQITSGRPLGQFTE